MTPWRHRLRRLRFALGALIAALLIAAAVVMGLVQLLLPLATHYPDWVARELSARLHRPVKFAALESEWQPSGPLLVVRGLTLGPVFEGGQSVTLPHAALKFDFGAWLRPAHRWITLRVSGMELRVVHDASGWRLLGFVNPSDQSRASLQSLPVDLDLRDLRVDIQDDLSHHAWQLFASRLRVVNIGNVLRFGGSIQRLDSKQTVTVAGRFDPDDQDMDFYLDGSGMDLAAATEGVDPQGYAVAGGSGDVELWGSMREGKLFSAAVRYALTGLTLTGPDGRIAQIPTLGGVADLHRDAGGWRIRWRGPGRKRDDIDAAGGLIAQVSGRAGTWRVSAAVRAFDVTPWLALLAMAPQAPKSLAAWVDAAKPHGRIDAAALAWREGGRHALTVRFSDLGAIAAGKIPGVNALHGVLRGDDQALSLELPAQPATLALPRVFRKPFMFGRLNGQFAAWRDSGQWHVAADDLGFDLAGMDGEAKAEIVLQGEEHKPFLSAYAVLSHGKVVDAKQFWPYRAMPPDLVKWLDHALVGGDLASAHVLFRGDLDDWPFLDHQGRFEAVGQVRNATFDYSDEWPRATDLDATASFIDNHMVIEATRATVQGVTASHAIATIPDLGHGVLTLGIQGSSRGAALLDFVRHSPVGKDAAEALKGISVGGTGAFGLTIVIPLDDASHYALQGRVDLAHADITADKWKLKLQNVSGPMIISGPGFRAENLNAVFRGAPAKFSLAVAAGVADPNDVVEGSLDARLSPQVLMQDYPDLAGLAAHAKGVAPFHIGVNVTSATRTAPATPVLTVTSNLDGVALDFPAPLDKPADTSLPLKVTLTLPPDGAPLAVSLGDVMQLRGRLADPAHGKSAALAVGLGTAVPATVPAGGMVVTGHAARLDLSGWAEQGFATAPSTPTAGTPSAMPELTTAQLSADDARIFGTSLGALTLDYATVPGAHDVTFDGAAIAGRIELPATAMTRRGVTATLQRLYWPETPPPKHPPPAAEIAKSPVAPASLPPLHFSVGDLRLGKARLGETRFESVPTAAGMHIAQFESKGRDFAIHAQGDWNGSTDSSHSRMVIDIASGNFGDTLDAFGFSGLLAGGEDAHVHIDGTWPGAPSAFALDRIDGTLKISVGEGRILAVQPGLGRVLGLLSLRELPSRLTLHFGDVFKSGFGFNTASADFTLRDGSAYTRDMVIRAPAAQIKMQGRTGLRAHDYDMTVAVTPHVGGTLPVVGAVIGGPVGAAAGLVVQGLIGKGINNAVGSVYRVTGSWDKPVITTLTRAPAPAASGSTQPAPAGSVSAPAAPASAPAPAAGAPPSASSG